MDRKKEEYEEKSESISDEMMGDTVVMSGPEILATEHYVSRLFAETRKSRKLTQKELSRISGINQADISRIENGNGNPSIRTIKRLADALDCDFICNLVPKG